MKTRFGLVAISALLMAGFWPTPVESQRVEFELTPFAGGTFFLSNPPSEFLIHRSGTDALTIGEGEFKNQFTFGLDAGVRIDERYGVEAFFSWLPTELSAATGLSRAVDVNGYMYGLTFLYHFDPAAQFKPFLGLGVGAETFDYKMAGWDTETEYMGNVVAGANVPLTDLLALRLEARDCITFFDPGIAGADTKTQNDLMLLTGLSFRFR